MKRQLLAYRELSNRETSSHLAAQEILHPYMLTEVSLLCSQSPPLNHIQSQFNHSTSW